MKKFVIFGNPIKHSKSPAMHNLAFKSLKIKAHYDSYLLEDGSRLKEVFLENGYEGANITVPYKEIAYKLADETDRIAQEIGAVNTYILDNNKIYGYNTDGFGFLEAISEFKNINKVLILGAGGTARAIAVVLKERGVEVIVVNRSKEKLEFFKNLEMKVYTHNNFILDYFDLIINTTSAGLSDNEYPIEKPKLENIFLNTKYAFDCIYSKETPFLSLAKKENLIVKDGSDMLLYQGVLALQKFISKNSIPNDVIQKMKEVLLINE